METRLDLSTCPWMQYAFEEAGVHELYGPRNSTRVIEFFKYIPGGKRFNDEDAWCSAFVNYCMKRAGITGSKKANARSWLDWGESVSTLTSRTVVEPPYGAVTVVSRPGNPAWGHVSFFVGRQGPKIVLYGGNQGNPGTVCARDYPITRLLDYRSPAGFPLPSIW